MLCIEKKAPSEEEKWRRATRRQKNTFILCVWAWLKKKQNRKSNNKTTLSFTGEQVRCCCCCIHTEVRFSNAAMSPGLICHWCRLIQSSAAWLDVAVAWQTGSFILTLSHRLQQQHAGKTHAVTSLSLYCGPTVHSPAGRGQESLAP